jgi:hypothetical protein
VLAIAAEVRQLEPRDDLTLLGVGDLRGGSDG